MISFIKDVSNIRKFIITNEDNLYCGETGILLREKKYVVLLRMISTGFNEEMYFAKSEIKETG